MVVCCFTFRTMKHLQSNIPPQWLHFNSLDMGKKSSRQTRVTSSVERLRHLVLKNICLWNNYIKFQQLESKSFTISWGLHQNWQDIKANKASLSGIQTDSFIRAHSFAYPWEVHYALFARQQTLPAMTRLTAHLQTHRYNIRRSHPHSIWSHWWENTL